MRTVTSLLAVALVGLVLLLSACDTFTGSSQIADLETRSAQLQGTIQGVGTPLLTIAALEQAATQNGVFRAQLTESAVSLLQAQSTLTVLQLSGGVGVPAPAFQTTPAAPAAPPGDQGAAVPTPAPTATLTQSRFTATVLTTELDAQDCPASVMSTFEPATPLIFVNTRIDSLPSGSLLSARWFADGQLFFDDTECWIPDEDYADICAYCSIVPDGETFAVGAWTVELYLDGQLMSQARFEIADAMQDTGGADTAQ